MNFKNNGKSLVECKNIVIKFEIALILSSHWYTGSMPTLTLLARVVQVIKKIIVIHSTTDAQLVSTSVRCTVKTYLC